MPHLLIIIEAIETLESKQGNPPTQAQQNLMAALHAADEYCHENPGETADDIVQYIEVIVLPYLQAANPISDYRLPTYTNAILAMIP